MLISIDKRGSVSLPIAIRKKLGLSQGSYLDLSIEAGGNLLLRPVEIYPSVRLSEEGLAKLDEARSSGTGDLPDWLLQEMSDAAADTQ